MSGVGRYIAARLAFTIPMVLILLSLIFVILRVIPGDPCLAMLGGLNVTPQQIASCRHILGVDRPLTAQYMAYIGNLLRGNFGTSIRTGLPVLTGREVGPGQIHPPGSGRRPHAPCSGRRSARGGCGQWRRSRLRGNCG